MKIYNYGNDYVHQQGLSKKPETVTEEKLPDNVEHQIQSGGFGTVSAEKEKTDYTIPAETKAEKEKTSKTKKKERSDNSQQMS